MRAGKDGAPVTDGPFPEAKEFLAGYWIVEVDRTERAYDLAARASAAPGPGGAPLNLPIEVRQVMSNATVFACPSVYEPLGIVNLEAMATETAVVARAVGGIPEVVQDGTTGYLVDYDPARAGDADYIAGFEQSFAQRINELTRDPERAAQFGRAGRQRCIEQFSWEKIARQTVEVYQAALQRHRDRTGQA